MIFHEFHELYPRFPLKSIHLKSRRPFGGLPGLGLRLGPAQGLHVPVAPVLPVALVVPVAPVAPGAVTTQGEARGHRGGIVRRRFGSSRLDSSGSHWF